MCTYDVHDDDNNCALALIRLMTYFADDDHHCNLDALDGLLDIITMIHSH